MDTSVNRKKLLKLNTIFGFLYQAVSIICGFVLPRLILVTYGSELNGLVNSIQSILSVITLMEMGVGAVVQSALYKPLAENDLIRVSKIVKAARKYFFVVGIALVVLVIAVVSVYPFYVSDKFDIFSTILLIVAMSITLFAQYFLGIVNGLLISADQRVYVYNILQIISLILNTILCAIFMKLGYSIQAVKFITAIVFLIKPIGLFFYVRKKYSFVKVDLDGKEIPQKWNGVAQHVASYVLNNTDIIVLTFFSSLASVSIYSTYYLIANSLLLLVVALTSGLQSYYGNIYAMGEIDRLKKDFDRYSFLINTFCLLIYGVSIMVITPFVLCYTSGINDANYNQFFFGSALIIAYFIRGMRTTYNLVILAVGHYKQTQLSAIIEALLNIIVSVILVIKFDLIGVAIGTIVAMLYRTIYFAYYCSKNIIYRNMLLFCKDIILHFLVLGISFGVGYYINVNIVINNYFEWIILSLIVTLSLLILIIVVNLIFNRKRIIEEVCNIFKR